MPNINTSYYGKSNAEENLNTDNKIYSALNKVLIDGHVVSSLSSNSEYVKMNNELKRKIAELEYLNITLKTSKQQTRNRKKKKLTFLEMDCKRIAKDYLFKKVKFISSENDLNEFEKKSIGAYFIKQYRKVCVNHNMIDSDEAL